MLCARPSQVRNEMCLLQVSRALLTVRRSVASTRVQHLQKRWQLRVKERKASGGPTAEKKVRDDDWMAAKSTFDGNQTEVHPQVEGRITNLAPAPAAA